GNYHYISPEKKHLIATLSIGMNNLEITWRTNVSERTIRRLLANWRKTGNVTILSDKHGRPRTLSLLDMDYVEGLLERTPDMYLSEIQKALGDARDVYVSLATISNSL
ncbi:hypothetical protein BT96DRAFT_758873, partial [Gymnopus androsaceus JB14]